MRPTIARGLVVCLGLLALAGAPVWAACTGSSPTRTAASPAQAEVTACLTAAVSGDTIVVPAGAATWATPIALPNNKDLTLTGAAVVTCSGGA